MVSILAIGDIHIKTSNYEQINNGINSIISWTHKINPDFVVLLGDVLDKFSVVHLDSLNCLNKFLLKLSKICPVYVLVGNHDARNNRYFGEESDHILNVFKNIENVVICDKCTKVKCQGNVFVMVPYTSPGRFLELLNSKEKGVKEWRKAKIIFSHQEFYGVRLGPIISENGDRWNCDYPLVINGHIHYKHWLQKNIYHPGSCIQQTFAEDPIKTIALIKIEEEKVNIKEKKVDAPIKQLVKLNSVKKAYQWEIKSSKEKTYWRLVIEDTYSKITSFKKSKKYLELKSNGVEIKTQIVPPKLKEVKEIKKRNFKDVLKSKLDDESLKILVTCNINL